MKYDRPFCVQTKLIQRVIQVLFYTLFAKENNILRE